MSTERPGGTPSVPPPPPHAKSVSSPSGQRTPNRQLAALIAEAGFSHAGLARRVDQLGLEHGLDLRYDKTSVTRWLRGQRPRGTTPALIAEVFTRRLGRRLSAQDLGLEACAPVYAGLEFAATPAEAVDIVAGLWRKDSGSYAELRKIAFTPAGLVVPSRDWLIGRPDDRVARGDPPDPVGGITGLPSLAGLSGHARVPEQSRHRTATAVAAPGRPGAADRVERGPGQRVTSGDIAALRSVAELFRALDNAYGGGHARQALVRYLEHELEPMLRGTYGEQTGRRLFSAAADLTRLAGWTAYDIAAHGLAQRYFVQALRLAQAAGDRSYGSYVLVSMSRQAVYLGHGREAVQLARVAQQGMASSVAPAVQALLHAVEARGHGLLGEVRACSAALARAERALESARPGRRCRPGPGSSTRRSWRTSSGTATATSSSTGPRPGTRNGHCNCAATATRAAGCSAGWCWPRRNWGWATWTTRARWRWRRPSKRPTCARHGPTNTSRTSNAAWTRTATPWRYAATGRRWRP